MARRLDWESERGRQRLAATSGSLAGEGSRPAPDPHVRPPLPVVVVSVRLSEADKRRLGGQVGQVAKAMPHLRSARLAVIAKEKRAARQQTQLAWTRLRPVVVALRRTGNPEDKRLAARLARPVKALLAHGVRADIPDLDTAGIPTPPAATTAQAGSQRAGSTPARRAGTSARSAGVPRPAAPPRLGTRAKPVVCPGCSLALSAVEAARGLSHHDAC